MWNHVSLFDLGFPCNPAMVELPGTPRGDTGIHSSMADIGSPPPPPPMQGCQETPVEACQFHFPSPAAARQDSESETDKWVKGQIYSVPKYLPEL